MLARYGPMKVAQTPESANRRRLWGARIRTGIGLYLLLLAVLEPFLFAGLPAWTLWDIGFTMAILGGLGGWQTVKGARRLRAAADERRLLAAKKPAELPEARIV